MDFSRLYYGGKLVGTPYNDLMLKACGKNAKKYKMWSHLDLHFVDTATKEVNFQLNISSPARETTYNFS